MNRREEIQSACRETRRLFLTGPKVLYGRK